MGKCENLVGGGPDSVPHMAPRGPTGNVGVLQASGDLPLVHLQLERVDLVDVTGDSAGGKDVGLQARDGDPPA